MEHKYSEQVDLLVKVLPYVAREKCFALKGGTAINLFYSDMPRLSVDIDLTYIDFDNRETAYTNINAALGRIVKSLNSAQINAQLRGNNEKKILCSNADVNIKIEPNYTLRGILNPASEITICNKAKEKYGFVKIQVISKSELYGGKICAALDRQHPRDLFDVKHLLEQGGGISKDILRGFIVLLLSGNRPLHEIILPNILDNSKTLQTEFQGMTDIEFTYDDHLQTLDQLICIVKNESKNSYKDFLLDFIALKADLTAHGLDKFPAIQWKLNNIRKLKEVNPQKFEEQYAKLLEVW
ncbi:MAG: nucleotidyl transferase AbiEii/AbiGii toxin family protein [Treponema sp.]|nr:nucleotidyl transferase AbiEii/AbiGii toxin family protein [Treponema sp.]